MYNKVVLIGQGWGILYADDAGIVSKSAEGLAKMMTVIIVTVFEAAGLTVSDKKTETMLLRTPDQTPCTSPLVIETAAQRYRQTTQFLYLGGLVDASADVMSEIKRRVRLAWACYTQSIQAGDVRYGGCPVRSEVAHAKGRGGGNCYGTALEGR